MQKPIEIFFSYAHEDEELMDDVRRQLSVYDKQNAIVKWHDRLIPPGGDWAGQIDDRLRKARVILLFVSPHFIESKYCYEIEMAEALRRQKAGEATVIPIILRPCPWTDSPLGQLQALPKNGTPITLSSNRDLACLSVAEGIMSVVRAINGGGPATVTLVEPSVDEGQTETAPPPVRREGPTPAVKASGWTNSPKWIVTRVIAATIVIIALFELLIEFDVIFASSLWYAPPIIALYAGCEVLLFVYLRKKRRDSDANR